MNDKRAKQFADILTKKGWDTQIGMWNGTLHVGVLTDESREIEKDIRNSIPMWMWFAYGVTSQTIHEPNNKMIVSFDAKR